MKKLKRSGVFILLALSIMSITGFQTAKAQGQAGFIGEIRMFAGNFAPAGWAFCDGSIITIASNTALFSILGTTYGGDGRTTFGLPDLRGRMPIGPGTGLGLTPRTIGDMGGEESHTLSVSEIPSHTHWLTADSIVATSERPTGKLPARDAAGIPQYGSTANTTLAAGAVGYTGGSQPHNNMPPYTCVNFIICVTGTFPTR